MKRKILKIIILFLAVALIFSNIEVLADSVQDVFTGTVASGASGATKATKTIVGSILNIVRIVGMGIALIMLTYVGIKIMTAAPSERASIKQYCTNYVIGAFFLIGGTGILTIVKKFAGKISA
jgi:hypothetical protein